MFGWFWAAGSDGSEILAGDLAASDDFYCFGASHIF
jgi:hypothetical protein